MTQPLYITRMEGELAELVERRKKLALFICHNPMFETLTSYEQRLLRAQHSSMETYSEILAIRLDMAKQPALPLEA